MTEPDQTPLTDRRAAPPAWLAEVPLAHRGLHDEERPENSLPAFEAAAREGYGVELDVHLSRDGVPVVLHDPDLGRVAGHAARVGDLTVQQLRSLRLGGTTAHVPSLAEALERLSHVPVMVELKQERLRVGSLEQAVATVLDGHPGPWCVAAFNPLSVSWFRRRRPDAVRVLTSGPLEDVGLHEPVRRRLAALTDLPRVAPHAVSYDLSGLPNPATDRWRASGGLLLTWTAVGPEGLARARSLADNVIFEHVRP
ncbi:MAG: glycerophosphodiester phosphodiesterase family protein [Nitriliruptoraceae bacterium]